MMALQYPPPQNWQDFETMCRELMERAWGAPAQKHGRSGQRQSGVDLYAQVGGQWVAAQCKLKNWWRGGAVTQDELVTEVKAATKFENADRKLTRYTLLTTAERDASIQKVARRLSGAPPNGFAVDILFWDDFVDRLPSHPDLLQRFYGWCQPDAARDEQIRSYLMMLREKLQALPFAAIGHAQQTPPTLETVYTTVDVGVELRRHEPHGLRAQGHAPEPAPPAEEGASYLQALREALATAPKAEADTQPLPSRRVRAVEFLAAHPRAVLLGPPGSGKSAFGSFVALCLANHRLYGSARGIEALAPRRPDEPWTPTQSWPHGALLPLFVELRAFVADTDAFPSENQPIEAGHLLTHLNSKAARCRLPEAMLPIVRTELARSRGRGVMLILDGLDETPNAEQVRVRLKRAIETFAAEYPGVRLLVTSRPYAYRENSEWRLPSFAVETLAPLSEAAITSFVQAWYSWLGERGLLAADVEQRTRHLLARLQRDRSLRPFVERPLMLTLLTSLHASGKMTDGGRATVYAESVQLLFDRWNEVAHHDNVEYFTDQFRMQRDDVLTVLAEVACQVHAEQGRGTAGAAPIPFQTLWDAIGRRRPTAVGIDERKLLEYLDERAGILLAEGAGVFRFPHRSFQEFLAARHLKADDEFPEQLVRVARTDPVLWREVLRHALLSHAADGSLKAVWDVLEALFDDHATVDDPTTARLAIAVGVAMAESERLRERARNAKGATREKIDRVRNLLVQCLARGVLSAADRVEAGDALGQLGDPRIGHRPENFLPWEPGGREGLGKYLVTVQEFAEFVAAGGYGEPRYWESGGGKDVLRERGWQSPEDWVAQGEFPNRPVVGISWFEAVAYCCWRGESTSTTVRLPTPDEWQQAALSDRSNWPWGEPDVSEELANYNNHVGHPSAVGCYAAGAGRYGHLDLAGNVAEWTDRQVRSRRRNRSESNRGGAWRHDAAFLRYWLPHGSGYDADYRYGDVGVRVVAPASR